MTHDEMMNQYREIQLRAEKVGAFDESERLAKHATLHERMALIDYDNPTIDDLQVIGAYAKMLTCEIEMDRREAKTDQDHEMILGKMKHFCGVVSLWAVLVNQKSNDSRKGGSK